MLEGSRLAAGIDTACVTAPRCVRYRICEGRAAQRAFRRCELSARGRLIVSNECSCLRESRRRHDILTAPVGTERAGSEAYERRFPLLAQAVPVESHHGSIVLKSDVLRAPIAMTYDAAADRSHARASHCRQLIDVPGPAARGLEIEELAVRSRPQPLGMHRCRNDRLQPDDFLRPLQRPIGLMRLDDDPATEDLLIHLFCF